MADVFGIAGLLVIMGVSKCDADYFPAISERFKHIVLRVGGKLIHGLVVGRLTSFHVSCDANCYK